MQDYCKIIMQVARSNCILQQHASSDKNLHHLASEICMGSTGKHVIKYIRPMVTNSTQLHQLTNSNLPHLMHAGTKFQLVQCKEVREERKHLPKIDILNYMR